MAEVIQIGKRTIPFNPISEAIKAGYPDDMILLETMFTWDVPEAESKKRQMETAYGKVHPE